ncbi:MAG: hypothetical protein K9K64_04565 [Desulfohalobiaceae bacterium]|nr:hypothetical protein [Desulfohalobiaceae bacterium]
MDFLWPDFNELGLRMEGILSRLDQTGILFVVGLFFLLCVFFSGFCLLLYLRAGSSLKEMRQNLQELDGKMRLLEKSRSAENGIQEHRLETSELKSRFEKNAVKNKSVPEKYRYLEQLKRSGLGVSEVAEILEVSLFEAEQMLSLARSSKQS